MIDHLAGIIFVDDECGERLALGDEASFTAV